MRISIVEGNPIERIETHATLQRHHINRKTNIKAIRKQNPNAIHYVCSVYVCGNTLYYTYIIGSLETCLKHYFEY